MYRNPTPHTWIHRNRHSSGKCIEILPLTHECTEIIMPQVNGPTSYPSHMNAPKWSSLKQIHRDLTPHTWNHSSSKCTNILPLTHECTKIIISQVNAPESYPSHMNDKTISLMQRINLYSEDFSFTIYNLNGFRNHKYIYILCKELTDSIYRN